MSFAKKLKRKKSGDYEGLMEDMSLELPNSLDGFGYKFNKDGHLHHIATDEKFNFLVSQDHSYNQKHYEALGEVITEYVYELLQSQDVRLKKLEIPLKEKEKNAKGFIFVSENYEIAERLLVLVHGSGVVRAGQWARRLIINDCLDHGTQIPYIKQGLKQNYGIVVLNTNQHQEYVKGKKKDIQGSKTPEQHFSYVWKNVIEKAKAEKIFVVAHSYGGFLVVDYLMKNAYALAEVVAVAFTDSVHSLRYHTSGRVQEWFEKNSVNWVTSFEDLDTPLMYIDQHNKQCNLRVSAGTTIHEETSWKAMESIFSYFTSHKMELGSTGKAGDGKGKKRSYIRAESSDNVEGSNVSGSQTKLPLITLLELVTQNKGAPVPDDSGTGDDTTSQGGTTNDRIDKCSQGGTIDSGGADSVSGIGADTNVNDDKNSDGETDGDNVGNNVGNDSQVGTSVGACSTSGTDDNKSYEKNNIGTNGGINSSDGSQCDASHNDGGDDASAYNPSGPGIGCIFSLNQPKADGTISDDNPDGNMPYDKGNNFGKISSEETSGKIENDHTYIHVCVRNKGDVNGEMKGDKDDGHTSTSARRHDSKVGASTYIHGECMHGPSGQTDDKTATHQEEKSESLLPEHENMQVESEETSTLISENHEKSKL